MSSIGTIVRIIRPGLFLGHRAVVAGMGVVEPETWIDDGRRYQLAAFDENNEYVEMPELEAEDFRTSDLWPEWMDRIRISVYRSVTDNVGGMCSLSAFLSSDKYRERVIHVRSLTDEAEQKKAKKLLPMATISGYFAPRRAVECLQWYSWVMCIDIDADKANTPTWGSDLEGIPDLLRRLPFVCYSAHSCRGVGYFALVRVSMPDPSYHTQMFRQLQTIFKQLGVTIDPACSDVSRPRFISYDADAWWNLEDEPLQLDLDSVRRDEEQSSHPCTPQQPTGLQLSGSSSPVNYKLSPSEWEWRKVELVVEEAEYRGVDVTGSYKECLMLGASLHCFGDDGYKMWCRICALRGADHSQMRTKKELAVKWMSFSRMGRMRTDERRLDAFFKIFSDSGITYKDAIERQKRERRAQYRYR